MDTMFEQQHFLPFIQNSIEKMENILLLPPMKGRPIKTCETISILLLLGVSQYACEKDIQVNADKKEYPVVYAALNINDTAQYVRVQRAFLGDKPVSEMAQQADSIAYPPGTLEVKLYEGDGTNFPIAISMTETNEIPKEQGYFSNERNTLFKTTYPLNQDKTYRVEILNKNNNAITTGQTVLAHNASIENPGITSKLSFANNVYEYLPYKFRWTSGKNVRRYQLYLDFYYNEVYADNTAQSKKVRIFIGEVKTVNLNGGQSFEYEFNGETFYKGIRNAIKEDPNVVRREIGKFHLGESGHCDLLVIGASEELSIYMDVYRPSYSIVEEKPDYTNIQNGLGIFASINTVKRTNIALSQYSVKMFEQNDYTKDLKFCDPEPNPQITNCP